MRLLALISLLLATVGSACAQTVTGAEIVEFGKFNAVAHTIAPAPQTTLGSIKGTTQEVLIEKTTKIEAFLGTRFGIRFKLIGEPAGEVVTCTIRGTHPKFTNPASGRTTEVDQWESKRHIGEAEYTGFSFESRWELVPGRWTIQVVYDSKVVAEKTFDVTIGREPSN
jgi:Domain of unknown function (DUF3859)